MKETVTFAAALSVARIAQRAGRTPLKAPEELSVTGEGLVECEDGPGCVVRGPL